VASNISNIGTNYTESTAPTAISGNTTICTGGSTTLTAVGGTAGTGSTLNWFSGACGTGLPVGQGTSVTVSPAATTNYYVLRSGLCNITGCAGTTVTVKPLPTFSVTKSNVSCFAGGDGSITVSIVSGTTPYEYSSDNGLTYTAPTSSTTYTFTGLTVAGSPYLVRVRDGNECVSQQTCP
jgi:Ig-like domain CHU_C associated/SprB repeat